MRLRKQYATKRIYKKYMKIGMISLMSLLGLIATITLHQMLASINKETKATISRQSNYLKSLEDNYTHYETYEKAYELKEKEWVQLEKNIGTYTQEAYVLEDVMRLAKGIKGEVIELHGSMMEPSEILENIKYMTYTLTYRAKEEGYAAFIEKLVDEPSIQISTVSIQKENEEGVVVTLVFKVFVRLQEGEEV